MPVTEAKEDELEEEAEWIYNGAFTKPTISHQVNFFIEFLKNII